MAEDIRIELENLKQVGKKYVDLLDVTSKVIKDFNSIELICDSIASRTSLASLDVINGNSSYIKSLKKRIEEEYEIFDKGIDEFIKADKELSGRINSFLESEITTNEKYTKRLQDKKYEERAKEIARILEDILGKYEYIDENGNTVVYNQIEARNLYSKDEFKLHDKVIIKRTEMPDGQYIDVFIDADTGEAYKRISHVLDGNSQEAIKLGIERDKLYIEYETYSDDTATEGFKSWGFSLMNCLVQDGYSLGQLGCYILYFNDPQTKAEKIRRLELRKQGAEEYFRGNSRSQKLFNDMETGYRVYEIVGMTLSVGELISNIPQLLAKGKNGLIKGLDFIEECVQNTKTLLKDAKKMKVPSMDDILGYFNRLTNNNGLEPVMDGVSNGKYIDDVDVPKKPQVDKIEGGSGTKDASGAEIYTDDMKKYIITPENGFDALIERRYIDIRKVGFDDVSTVAKNTGLSEQDIIDMKKHLFLNTHDLSLQGKQPEKLYFQANPDISYAWQKAQKGELTDLEKEWFDDLRNHELTEKKLMDEGMPLTDPSTWDPIRERQMVDPSKNAHNKANLTAECPADFPGYDSGAEFCKYYDKSIDY